MNGGKEIGGEIGRWIGEVVVCAVMMARNDAQ